MTYIDLINAVWELREQGVITMYEHDLYNFLLHKCNRLNWKNPFFQSTTIMCAVLSVSRNALMDRRRKLKQLGLITYKEGTAKTRPAEYRILTVDSRKYLRTDNKGLKGKTNESQPKKESFRKPSKNDVIRYCSERGNIVDAGDFYDFYQSKNWMIGRNKMKDWRAAIRTWERKLQAGKHNSSNHDNGKKYEKF